ncbi:MAG: twin-arginine translocation signal domain-containing protein, partial [Anaerolineae bacterium]|nr:twin-arginine translocation signal domain-containing protein [Anaerolineae bacterium]
MKKNLNRRDFMKMAGLTGLGIAAVACAPAQQTQVATEAPAEPTATAPSIVVDESTPTPVPTVEAAKYKQAPMLDGMDLPPVEERISANPLVTAPVESIGKYGGTLRTASWWPGTGNVLLYISEPPIKWKADLTGYEPALAEAYEWSDDGLTFTMTLRKGVKWSDGEPYTSEDWKFCWEDILKNEEYKVRSVPGYTRKIDGSPIDMEFPDEYTVVWKSDKPLWIAPYYLAQGFWEFGDTWMKPAHYMKKFHPTYDSTKKYEDLEKIDKWHENPDFPTVFAWHCSERAEDGTRNKWSRNPYYWRVDTEGNQLPYIDEIDIEIVSDAQVRLLSASQGKYDTSFRAAGDPNDIPFLEEQAASGGYKLLKGWMNGAGAWPGYMVNQYYVEGGKNYEDDTPEHAKEIRDLLRDKRFRKAVSTGFDRQRIIDVAWNGIGDPKAATISPQAWHFASAEGQEVYKNWAAADASFEIEAANAALDEIGMVKGADGFRTLPSGKPFIMTVDVSDWGGSLKVQTDAAAEFKVEIETNLGIQVEVKNLQGQPELDTRTNEGQYMLRGAHISEVDIWTYPDWIFPIVNRYMFPLEGRYYAKGKETCVAPADKPYDCGVKPEPGSPAEKIQALYEKGLATKTVEDRHKVVWEAVQVIIDEGPFVIGVSGDQQMPVIVKEYMRNILDFGVVGPWAP